MSISTSTHSISGVRTTPSTDTRSVSLAATSDIIGVGGNDKLDDDERRHKLNASVKTELSDSSYTQQRQQQVKRRKEGDVEDTYSHLQASSSAQSSAIKSAAAQVATVEPRQLVPSIVRLNSIEKIPSNLKQPFIVTGHIVEHRSNVSRDPHRLGLTTAGSNSNSTGTRSAGATGTTNTASNNVVKGSASNNNNNNGNNNNLRKLANSNQVVKHETASHLLSKTSGAPSGSLADASYKKTTPPSRPDLVASSISALHAGNHQNQARTRPLLMSHNHQLHPNHNQHNNSSNSSNQQSLGATSAQLVDSKNIKFDTNRAIATTLSSQLILSSIITASPGFKAQQLTGGGSLNGLQFCLSAQPSHMVQAVGNNSNSPTSDDLVIPSSQVGAESNKISNSPAPTQAGHKSHTTPSPASSSKSKGSSKSTSGECMQALERPASSSSAHSSGNGNGLVNVAAARLLDLGKRLLEATKEGNIGQVRELVVDSGAPFTSDWLDTTALHIAAQNGSADIAEILINGGINKDAQTKLKRTALHLAAQSGSLEVTDLLIRAGSEVNCRDMLLMTPLHWAVERGHLGVVERLLMANADCTIKSKFRLTPLDIARQSGFFEMIELLKSWTSGNKNDESLNSFRNLEATLNESQDFLDIDYHLALVDSAANSRDDSMLDSKETCLDLVGLEWNKFDFAPELFLPNNNEDEQNVGYLMKIVEELQKENQQLRQKVEQLSTTDQ